MDTLAILVAAGRGERLGAAMPKAFVAVGGESLLRRSARALASSTSVDGVVAVVPSGLLEEARSELGGLPKLVAVVEGGFRRQDSVLEGLKQAPEGFDGVVLVHDAARPFVDSGTIERVAAMARSEGAALPAIPVTDTVKRVSQGFVVETLSRSELFAAQTPQGVRFELLARALEAALRTSATVTDEAMAVEALGERVAVVPGDPRNRKITTREDLEWAEKSLAGGAGA